MLDLYKFMKEQGIDKEFFRMTDKSGNMHRGIRIAKWLNEWKTDVSSYVILDDDDVRPHNRLVRTSWEDGLTPQHVEQALRILETPVEKWQ
jgi:hypothetical protein